METLLAPLPAHARVWVYQASRALTGPEVAAAQLALDQFVQAWDSHGQRLAAAAAILHHRFVVLAVDQAVYPPSGCAIDKSVALVRQLEQHLGLGFLDRGRVAYRAADGQVAATVLAELKAKVALGEIRPDTLVFNTLVENLHQLRHEFEAPASQTWLARYLPKVSA
jgi:hypothetical protein